MLWTVLFSACLFCESLAVPKKQTQPTGLIHDFLVKHINHSASPCDNFYSHVCPRNVKKADLPLGKVFPADLLKQINKQRKPNRLERDLAKVGNLGFDFYRGLRVHLGLVDYVNEKYPDSVPIAYPLREKLNLLAQTTVQQIQRSVPYQDQTTTELLVHQALRTNYYTGWTNLDYNGLSRYYDLLNSQYEKALKKTDAESALDLLDVSIQSIYELDGALYGIISSATHVASQYLPNTENPLLYNAFYLLSLGEDPAVQHGSTFVVAGHEMHHSVFILIEGALQNNSKALENRKCLANHNKKVSKMYHDEVGDPDPNTPAYQSSMSTFKDDAPDLEGTQASYTMLKDVLKLDLEAKPYADLPLNRAQLFFYALAAMNCFPPSGQWHTPGESHSSWFVRVNGPLSLMKAFVDTFQCGPETRMGKLYHDAPAGKCNQVGDPVKKA